MRTNDKIIFWLDANLINFGLAHSLQKQYDCELYSIIDITDKPKKFFQTQDIVKFKKTWFYHDYIIKSQKKPDLTYLRKFEEKYEINLWLLACNDRFFYEFNEFHKFSVDQILIILEQECRLFESILDEVKPDFLIMATPNFHYDYLFYLLCDAKNIKIMIMRQTRFGYRCMISKEMDKVDYSDKITPGLQRTIEDLQQYHEGHNLSSELNEYKTGFLNSKLKFINAVFRFLFSSNDNVKTHYTYYGRTKFRVLIKSILYSLRSRYREFFINKNFVREINNDLPFVYFPLHVDLEHTMLLGAPYYTNQLEVIRSIIKSLPVGFMLYVKEHPLMNSRGWRKTEFYKEIMNLPNTALVHPSVKPNILLKKCSLVIAILGTSSLEAAFHKKPSISFVDLGVSVISSIQKLHSFDNLSKSIRSALKMDVDIDGLNKYVNMIDNNSFDFNYSRAILDYGEHFYYGAYLVDVEITLPQMNSYLEKNSSTFGFLALEHIKKIHEHKERDPIK